MLDGLLRYGKLLALGCLLALPLLASPVTAADTAKVDAVAIVLPGPAGSATGSARDVTAKVLRENAFMEELRAAETEIVAVMDDQGRILRRSGQPASKR